MVHLLFLLEAKLTSVTKVKTSTSQKGFITNEANKTESSHIKSRNLPQATKKMECPVIFQTKKIISFPESLIKKISNGIGLNLQKIKRILIWINQFTGQS